MDNAGYRLEMQSAGFTLMPVRRRAVRAARAPRMDDRNDRGGTFYNLERMPQREQVADDTAREAVINRAIEVIGDRKAALRWLGTPVPALQYQTPISLLDNSEGQATVLSVLSQLEHGVL